MNKSPSNLDTLSLQLNKHGVKTRTSWLFDQPEFGVSNGTKIDIRGSEIVFQVSDHETVLVVLYRKSKADRQSLSCSFTALFWFVRFIINKVPSVKYVKGLVDVNPYKSDKGISSRRLMSVYKRCGADEVTIGGERWAQLNTKNYKPIR